MNALVKKIQPQRKASQDNHRMSTDGQIDHSSFDLKLNPISIASNPKLHQEKVNKNVFGLGCSKDVSSEMFMKEIASD